MKIAMRIVAAAAVALIPLIAGSSAFAEGTCQIGYTGPNSNNECTLTSTFTCTVKNNNDFDIRNENNQVVGSGTAAVADNTSGGSAISGSATNSNGTTVNVSIKNSESGKLCTVVSTVPAIPVPPVAPTTPPTEQHVTPSQQQLTPGRGAVVPSVKQTVQAPQKAAPTALPNTSGDGLPASIITLTGLLAAGAAVARLAVASYSRMKS